MLTSSNQYLRPEYLTPLPTTLDAKKSPLALLAQTCSQIGADTPNKLAQSVEKSSKSSKSDNKLKSPSAINESGGGGSKSSFKPYESGGYPREKTQSPEERSNSVTSRVRTPINSKSSVRCNSNQSVSSPGPSPNIPERKTPAHDETQERNTPAKTNDRNASPRTPTSTAKSSTVPSILTSTTDPTVKDLPLGTFKPGSMPPTSTWGGYPPPGIPLPMDLMASSLLSHHQALKSGAYGPYANYARLKGEALAPTCRDPYCTGCSLSSHLLGGGGKSGCPAGCTQCDHASKSPVGYLGHSPIAAYAHAQLAAIAAASQLPYVCSWIGGDATYCGKRFSNSEELLQHLRTHTSLGVSEANSTLSMLSGASLPPTHPLLHRTYPTPPLSPLATARYHPYSKPSLLPPLASSPLSSFPMGHPGLPPYLSAYSLYGPRLGTTSGMHP